MTFITRYVPTTLRSAGEFGDDVIGWCLDTAYPADKISVDVNWSEIPEDVKPTVDVLVNLTLTMFAAIVDKEDQISLKVCANHRRMMMTVAVSNDDVGFAIGTKGANASAVRTILTAACKKLKFHFEMDICGSSGQTDWST